MIVIRTDASTKTGFGHVKRSAYLASLLRSKTGILFCVNKDKAVTRFLDERGFESCSIKRLQHLDDQPVKSIIFDLRHFGEEDVQLIEHARGCGRLTVQVTDLGLSQQNVDYTIDSSPAQLFPYPPGKQHLLLGPGNAILHHRFRHFNKIKRKYRQNIKKVFLCLGGAVEYRLLRNVVDLLSRQQVEIKVAPGYYLKKSAQKALKRIYHRVRFVGETDTLARAFFEADVAFVAPGVSAYEAAAAGTPALYCYYHDEQRFVAKTFEKNGAGLEICKIDDLLHVDITEKLELLSLEKRIQMGAAGKKLVDARGVYRVIDFFKTHGII